MYHTIVQVAHVRVGTVMPLSLWRTLEIITVGPWSGLNSMLEVLLGILNSHGIGMKSRVKAVSLKIRSVIMP